MWQYDGYRISIHTFLAEGDTTSMISDYKCRDFNPHLPCGRWLIKLNGIYYAAGISIHTFLAEGDVPFDFLLASSPTISIHTFLAEGDLLPICSPAFRMSNFNPHLPCGRWQKVSLIISRTTTFQSTPSLRKVTFFPYVAVWRLSNFNPHLPCGRWHHFHDKWL